MFSPSTGLSRFGLIALLALILGAASAPVLAQNAKSTDQLPEGFRGVKIYKLPTRSGQPQPNFGIYRKVSYEDINLERLQLALSLSIRAVDHPATVEHIYFQDVRANGIPIHIETFNQEFKLSNRDPVDVPAPLKCAIVFSDLDSLRPVRDLVDKDSILITGQSFIEVKLGTLETLAARARQVVIPVPLNESVPLNLFEGKPLLHVTASTILDTLANPSSAAAIALAKEHLAKLHLSETLESKVKPALYLLMTQYQVRDPKSNAAEQFSQSGTGFLVNVDGKLLTSKRVVEPWKFDPGVDFLIEHQHMVLDKTSVKIYAWPAGVLVMGLDGQPDFASALSTDHQSLNLIRMAPDEMVKQDYVDPGSGESVTLHVHADGLSDLAVLQISKGTNLQPLSLPDPASNFTVDAGLVLCSYPFGVNQPRTVPRLLNVQGTPQANWVKMEHTLDPGESGAPLLNGDGKVVAVATSANQGIPIQIAQKLIP